MEWLTSPADREEARVARLAELLKIVLEPDQRAAILKVAGKVANPSDEDVPQRKGCDGRRELGRGVHTGSRVDAFLISFGVIFVAELGDKSQLMAMAFASRYRALTVLVTISVATLLVHAVSVLIGAVFALALPTSAIQVVAGIAFLGFALWTLRGDELGDADQDRARRSGGMVLLSIGTAFFLAELGDKTMLATITLASTENPWGVWLGSTAGMVAADAIAIGIGALLGTRLPERAIRFFAAALFVVFGVVLIAEGLKLL
jgi:putative Ca2+/H+ antiporter (TMEM165/GDT1 family)